MNRTVTLLAAAVTFALGGCSTMTEIRQGASDTTDRQDREAQILMDSRPARAALPVTGPVVTDLPYVDARPTARAMRYPASFNRQITVNDPAGTPLKTLAQRVEALTGLRVMYQSELAGAPSVASSAPAPAPRADAGGDATLENLPPLTQLLPQLPTTAAVMPRSGVAINYTGDVRGLLNAIASATDADWEYDEAGQVVSFYRYRTQSFRIPEVQGEAITLSKMGGQGQSSGDGGAISMASAEAEHRTSASIWKELDVALKQLVSPVGTYALSETTGTVTVRDRPDRVDLVRKYLQDMTAIRSRQVSVDVTVYRVTINDADTRALNWSLLFRKALSKYTIGLDTMAGRPDNIAEGLSSLIINVPQTDAAGNRQPYGGSQVIMDALSTIGRASVWTNVSVVTANNQAAPVKVVRRTSYLASVAQNVQAQGGAIQSTGPTLTPGMVETGLNMYVIPSVHEDGKRIQLAMMGSLSTLESLDTYGNDLASIQLPQVSSREISPKVWLTSGETLVLAGFEQVDSGIDTRSPLDKSLWLLGGRSSAKKGREMVVIAVRPVVTAVRSRI